MYVMKFKVSKSVLLTSGCVTAGLSLSALTYMIFFWSPVQYHHLLVSHRLDSFWTQQERVGETSQRAGDVEDGRRLMEKNLNDTYRMTAETEPQSKTDHSYTQQAKNITGLKLVNHSLSSGSRNAPLPDRNVIVTTEINNKNISSTKLYGLPVQNLTIPKIISNVSSPDQGARIVTPQRIPMNPDLVLDFNKTVIRTNWTRSQKGKNWKAAKIIKIPQNLPPSLESVKERNETKYLVYLCDSRMNCGGLGDRERALTSVYIWSRVIQRKFKLVMTSPCNLSNFYVPNKVNWLPEDKELETPSDNNTLFIFQNLNKVTLSKLMDGDFNENFPQKYIYLRTNSDIYFQFGGNKYYTQRLREWSGLTDLRSRFFWSWHELMKPSDIFTSRLESILGSDFIRRKGLTPSYGNSRNASGHLYEIGNASLICAHVRIGKNPSNPKDEAFTAVTGEDIPVLFNFMKKKDKNGDARFFLATDYIYVRNQARKFFGSRYIDFGALISHIDRQRNDKDACLGFESALLDQTILSLCDVLITSRSGFSAKAAHMRNSSDPVYVIDGGEVRVAEE